MKKLKLAEIRQFLTEEQIESILSKELIHQKTEEILEKLSSYPTWTQEKRIYLYGNPGDNFNNNNWLYYRDRLRELQPRSLEINTNRLYTLPGLESFSELTEFYLGTKDPHHALHFDDTLISALFNQLFMLPKLKKIFIFFFTRDGGSADDHTRAVKKYHLKVKEVFPNAELGENGDYFPMIIHLNRAEKITACP
ncbi:MAG: hypothetical protein KBB70_01570 [Candidatus Pacebacteria bacterium]|jgi:hypothetical protein|nr:hypothetical protein [Candidatus Paceibacterota bacterium]